MPAGGVEERLRRRLARERAARVEAESIAERFTRAALHDPLTGLANRANMLDRLDVLLRPGRQGAVGAGVGLLFLDLDDFKQVNDRYGHAVGDEYLKAVSARLVEAARSSDLVSRIGGDEFVVVCEYVVSASDLSALADRLRAALEAPCDVAGHAIGVSASIGIRLARCGETAEKVLRDADAAMYAVKSAGKSGAQLYDPETAQRAATSSALRHDLARAVRERGLTVAYQPVVRLSDGAVAGAEALIRWRHPELGMVPPDEFIPLGEASGLVVDIDRFTLQTACLQAATWSFDERGMVLSVNAAIESLEDPEYVRDVSRVLRQTGLSPRSLTVEITERSLASDSAVLAENLASLRGLGVGLAIDDFGTEYSSFAYLRRLPVDILKIDRSFVSGVGTSARDEALVAAMVAVAKALGMRTVAEGIETGLQAEELVALGVDQGQGWHYAGAMAAADWPQNLVHGTNVPGSGACSSGSLSQVAGP